MQEIRGKKRHHAGLALMPSDSGERMSRRDIVRIARRFNAGNDVPEIPVPKGRLESWWKRGFNRPFGTDFGWCVPPSVETLGYCRMSLRDRLRLDFLKGINATPARPKDQTKRTPFGRITSVRDRSYHFAIAIE